MQGQTHFKKSMLSNLKKKQNYLKIPTTYTKTSYSHNFMQSEKHIFHLFQKGWY